MMYVESFLIVQMICMNYLPCVREKRSNRVLWIDKELWIVAYHHVAGSMGEAMILHPTPHTDSLYQEGINVRPVCRSSSPLELQCILNIIVCVYWKPTHHPPYSYLHFKVDKGLGLGMSFCHSVLIWVIQSWAGCSLTTSLFSSLVFCQNLRHRLKFEEHRSSILFRFINFLW